MEMIFNSFTVSYLARRLMTWLHRLQKGLPPGRYRFSTKGGLVPCTGQEGLVSSVFAGKILWNTGLWHCLNISERQAITRFIASFQNDDGFFRDPWLVNCLKRLDVSAEDMEQSIRAETRQALSFLLTVGEMPRRPVPIEFTDTDAIRRHMRSLAWENPWGACSHFSHQCFFMAASKSMGLPVPSSMEECLVEELFRHYHPATGTWYDASLPEPSMTVQINGMMKAFTGMAWLSPEVYTRLNLQASWETVHRYVDQCDSCSLFNQLYVLTELKRLGAISGQREISTFYKKYINGLLPFYHWIEGAFSFFPKKSQIAYYCGAPTSLGYNTSDLHGSVMQTWALSLLFSLMNINTTWQSQKV